VDLTDSYIQVVPADLLRRYAWAETRMAAAVLSATNPCEFGDVVEVLRDFAVAPHLDIFPPGGNESPTAARLNHQFRDRGWREGSYQVKITANLRRLPWTDAGETAPTIIERESDSASYLVDNLKGRVAIDVEWHAKDGNLDRDLAAYRSLYNETIIDGAVIVTMAREEMRAWALELDPTTKKFATSTTTNVEKLLPRLRRGDGGGCPVLVAAIGRSS
jgi:hypothetical protein